MDTTVYAGFRASLPLGANGAGNCLVAVTFPGLQSAGPGTRPTARMKPAGTADDRDTCPACRPPRRGNIFPASSLLSQAGRPAPDCSCCYADCLVFIFLALGF